MKIIREVVVIVWVVLMLAGCSGANSTPETLPTVVLDTTGANTKTGVGGVSASGVVVPAQEAQLAFALGGNIRSIAARTGDQVRAGDTLIVLDTTQAQLSVSQAEAEVAAAQASYDLAVSSGPVQAAANIAAAQLALLEAQNALDTLDRDAPLDAAQAQLALANAQKALDEAQKKRTNMDYPRANETTIESAQAWYDLKEDALKAAQEAYDKLAHLPPSAPERASALIDLTDAQRERDRALSTLNWYLSGNNDLDIAEADAELALAKAQLDAAETTWSDVKDGPSAEDVSTAKAKIASAQAQLDLAKSQPNPDELAYLQAQVDAARSRLEIAQAQLESMTIYAPFDGVVASLSVEVGEWITPGQPVLELVDTGHLRVETTDLSERDVVQVKIGQPVMVYVKAVDQDISGVVTGISPLADTLGGDVVYKTTIDLDTIPDGLYAGMSVEVQFETENQ